MRLRISPLALLAALALLIVLAPLAGVVAAAWGEGSAAIPAGDLAHYAARSAILAVGVGLVTAIIGSSAAWLIACYRFPGSGIFGWALALPLAMPGFALAYAYADLFDVAGPLRSSIRDAFGLDLPIAMRSLPGAVFVLSAAFYPYVYLAMRAAFLAQPGPLLDAARLLGCSRRAALWRVALPLARPALAAGVGLAMMETLADYGAVYFLNVQTLTTGVVRAWSVFGSTASAAQFALPLLAAAALLLWLERLTRTGQVAASARTRQSPPAILPLRGIAAGLATLFCLALLSAGLIIPGGWLLVSAIDAPTDWTRLSVAARNSLLLACAGAFLTVALATMLALGSRGWPLASRLVSIGYATPGAVMAIGLLAPAGLIWSLTPGSGMLVALVLLIFAYAARLMAAALEPIDAGLQRVTPSMRRAARTLGRGELGAAFAVELPLARGAMLTAALILLVDILKELPATLILRPFNFDTLAVIASNYATDERLGQAGLPTLLIVALALPVVIWLSGRMTTPSATPRHD